MNSYDRRAFALAYTEAQRGHVHGVDAERDGYEPAVLAYRARLLAGLEQLFGLRLSIDSVPGRHVPLFMLLRSTVSSYLAITDPTSSYLEFGLIDIRLGQAGIREPVYSRLESIRASNAESRTAHLEILDRLLEAMLGESADRVIQEEELRAIGVEPTPPDPGDYDF